MRTFLLRLVILGILLLQAAGLQAEPAAASAMTGLTFSNEVILSSDTELKAGDSKYQHVSFVHSNWSVAKTISVGQTGNLVLGLNYNLSTRRVTEPSDWEDDDFWEEYKKTHPDWKRVPIPKLLQSLTASVEYTRQVSDDWSLTTNVSGGSHVAGKKLGANGWGVSASVMGLYKWNSDVTVAVGAAYDSLSHDYRFVPLVGVDWQINEKWSAAIGFPATAVTYAMTKRFAMAIEVSGSGGTFHVQEEPDAGIAGRPLAGSKLETTEVRLGYKVGWKINDRFSISATTGHVLYREFKYVDRDYRLKSHDVAAFGAISGSISF
ncbi:MAG: DUF6268 family outer membrane beta-barrel protein [Nibricoccus sp.]